MVSKFNADFVADWPENTDSAKLREEAKTKNSPTDKSKGCFLFISLTPVCRFLSRLISRCRIEARPRPRSSWRHHRQTEVVPPIEGDHLPRETDQREEINPWGFHYQENKMPLFQEEGWTKLTATKEVYGTFAIFARVTKKNRCTAYRYTKGLALGLGMKCIQLKNIRAWRVTRAKIIAFVR